MNEISGTCPIIFVSALVTSALDPDPLYFPATTPDQDWAPRMLASMTGIGSLGLCSALCSLSNWQCELFVFSGSTGTCYFGQLAANSNYLTLTGSGSSVVYTRKCKTPILSLMLRKNQGWGRNDICILETPVEKFFILKSTWIQPKIQSTLD